MKRDEVLWVALDFEVGAENRNTRRTAIVSDDTGNTFFGQGLGREQNSTFIAALVFASRFNRRTNR